MTNGIDPRIVYYFGVWTSILLGIASAGTSFFDGALPAAYIPVIVKWCGILGFVNSVILTGGTGFSSSKAGPLVGTSLPPAVPPTIAKGLLIAFALLQFIPGAQAQTIKGCDPLNLKPGCEAAKTAALNNLKSVVTQPMQDLANFISKGLGDAATLAVAIPDLQDGNGPACWLMLQHAGEVLQAHPLPVTLNGALDLEAVRLLHMTAAKVCSYSPCTQVFNEATNVVSAAAPLKTPIPSMTQLCAQIPPIAVVAPFVTPVALPDVKPALGAFAPAATTSTTNDSAPAPAAKP